MNKTLYQIKQLEKYIIFNPNSIDDIFANTIAKLYNREQIRLKKLIESLEEQLKEFEEQYSLSSKDFDEKYNKGEIGDDIDFVEWSATIDMLQNAKKRQVILLEKQL